MYCFVLILNDNKENLQKYRFQKSIQQLEDHRLLSDLRKENAKIKTVLREKILNKDNSNG